MIGARTENFSARLMAAKDALSFGEIASALCLKGSSRTGWNCPSCGSVATVRERPDRKGARCTLHSCNAGFDGLQVVMRARGVAPDAALTFLERVIAERAARGRPKWPGLFDQGDASAQI